MPCMYNGQPVKGSKGACPTGSTWSDVTPTTDAGSLSSGLDALKSMDTSKMSDWARSRYVRDDGSIDYLKGGIEASWLYPGAWLARGGLKSIPWLMKNLFTKPKMKTKITKKKELKDPDSWADYIKNNPKGAIPADAYKTVSTRTKVPAMRTRRDGTEIQRRAFSPGRTALTGVGTAMAGQGWDYVAPFTERGKADKIIRDEKAAALATQRAEEKKNLEDKEKLVVDTAQAEKDRVANLSFTERMKEPGYWDEIDATGLTRVEKIGQLLSYYGQTPKQRADTTSPADRWAEMSTTNAATAAALEKSRLNLKGAYSNVGNSTLEEFVKYQVEEEYGDTLWRWGGAEEEEVAAITGEIMGYMIQFSKQNPTMMQGELYMLAKQEYEKAKAEREGS